MYLEVVRLKDGMFESRVVDPMAESSDNADKKGLTDWRRTLYEVCSIEVYRVKGV